MAKRIFSVLVLIVFSAAFGIGGFLFGHDYGFENAFKQALNIHIGAETMAGKGVDICEYTKRVYEMNSCPAPIE